jgi:hypothetical protein
MGFHRHFTHSSFKAARPLRLALGIAGSLALEGPLLVWVADHRRHHKYSDKDGDRIRRGDSAPARALWPRASAGHTSAGCSIAAARRSGSSVPTCRLIPQLAGSRAHSLAGPQSPCWLRRSSVGCGQCPRPARSPRSSGPASFASPCCITSPGRSTRSATCLAGATSSRGTCRQTTPGLPSRPSASHGTTCTTPTPPVPGTASCADRSISAHGSLAGPSNSGLVWDVRWPDEQRLRQKLTSAAQGRRFGGTASGQLARSRVRGRPDGQPPGGDLIAQQERRL